MLCTMKIKLTTDKEQFDSLFATMKQFNFACNEISKVAFNAKTFSKVKLQKLCYYDIRDEFSLSAQMTIRALGKVSESYKKNKKSLHTFRETGAIVYDQRILSFKKNEVASILTVNGRLEVPMVISNYHRDLMAGSNIRGQAELILQSGTFYLLLVAEIPENSPIAVSSFIGVDLGIKNIAVDSTGEVFSGAKINSIRRRNRKLRAKLQAKGTKSAKRLLRKRSKKERRFASDVNHCISKKLVEKAKDTRMGIALEDLKGIRKNSEKTVKKAQRSQHSSWGFYQLRQFIEYKALIAGVPVVSVDPRNTSRTCIHCGHVDKKNRLNRDTFHCQICGYAAPADNVASINIARRAM